MRFRRLGPVEVHASDGPVLYLPRRQERCMLAILLLDILTELDRPDPKRSKQR